MGHNSSQIQKRFPSLYRQDLLNWQREKRGWSQREVARRADLNFGTIRKVFAGKASSTKVYPVAKVLKVDWSQLHNLQLAESDFHLAVRNGSGQVKGRSALGEGRP